MSGGSLEELFLYKVPSFTMCRFWDVMDSLDDSVWKRFASMIIPDQTELRLLEQQASRSRTEAVTWTWINKNARVGDLLSVLRALELLRAVDIFESWWSVCAARLSPQRNAPQRRQPSPPPPYPHPTPAPELDHRHPEENKPIQTEIGTLPVPSSERLPLPLPEPPPKHLLTSSTCPSQSISSAGSSNSSVSSTRSSVQESIGPSSIVEVSKQLEWNFNELVHGTNHFSPSLLIGEGGFGCVYKATLRNTEYAVKRLKQDSELEWSTVKKSFLTEIEKLTCLRHPNIIDLAGYCAHGEEYCLIYLYLPNGSLEDRLHVKDSFQTLSWQKRVSILQGSACGIQFLHTYQPTIIHGDVKSSNILLDQALTPKLGDFGLARFSRYANDAAKSRTLARTSTVRGTLAYLPDEYVKMGKLTRELDTYSFGVVLLEVLTGRKAMECQGGSQTKYLKDLVKEEENDLEEGAGIDKGNKLSHVASRICQRHLDHRVGHCPADITKELCLLACRCLERQKKRPNMVEVFDTLKRLHGLLQKLEPRRGHEVAPPQSSFAAMLDRIPPIPDLVSSFQAVVIGPEENTAKVPTAKDSVRPFSSSGFQYEANLDSCVHMSSCKSLRTFQRGQNMPVESDESFPDSFISHGHSHLSVARTSREHCGSRSPSAASPHRTSALEGPSHLPPLSNLAGQESQAISMPHHQIIMNPAKQRIVEQLALYDQGKINSLELLSSGISPGSLSDTRGYPEESDDFPS
ncbi:interleukin-1 receptor-associated kinase 1 [Pelobates fuscus]|uniref:interleukin-1 receptor-associated kinase 1 n=1 Tax=Pelobates fuscus TaxID=191477 RepID=UPI002FE452DB